MIKSIKSTRELSSVILGCQNSHRLLVVFWKSGLCPPCQMFKPFFEAYAKSNLQTSFVLAEAEELENRSELLAKHRIEVFPTFTFYLDGIEVYRFSGANQSQFLETTQRFQTKAEDLQLTAQLNASLKSSDDNADSCGDAKTELLKTINKNEVEDPEPSSGEVLKLTLKRNNGNEFSVEIDRQAQVQHLRRKIAVVVSAELSAIRLIFRGRLLSDGKSLESYKINETGLAVHVAVSGIRAGDTASPSRNTSTSGTTGSKSSKALLSPLLSELAKQNGKDKAREAVSVLKIYLQKIVNNFNEEKYRKIRRENHRFAQKIGDLKGGIDCMNAIGFKKKMIEGQEYLVLEGEVDSNTLATYIHEIDGFLPQVSPSVSTNVQATPTSSRSSAGNGLDFFGSALPPGFLGGQGTNNMGLDPMFSSIMSFMSEEIMQNPELRTSIFQNMMNGQNGMEALASNPQFLAAFMNSTTSALNQNRSGRDVSVPPANSSRNPSNRNARHSGENDDESDSFDDFDSIYL